MDAVVAGSQSHMHSGEAGRTVSSAQLPLAMVGEGEVVRVGRVRGAQALRQHLAELGFVEGAEVVSVKGATFGLNRDMAMRIVTC